MFRKKKSDEELQRIYSEATKLYDKGEYEWSIKKFKILLRDVKNDPHCNHYIGMCHGKLNNFRKADKHFDKSIKYGQDALTWFNKGITIYSSNIKKKKKVYEKALRCVQQAILIEEKNPEFWYYRGIILSRLHRYKKAKEAFKECIRLQNNFHNRLNSRIFEHVKSNKS